MATNVHALTQMLVATKINNSYGLIKNCENTLLYPRGKLN